MTNPEQNEYHAHLAVCTQCAKQPFNLCPIGHAALHSAIDTIQNRIVPNENRSVTDPIVK